MTATVHILCGPAGSNKTRRLLQRHHEVACAELGAALWLGPNYRAVQAVREQMVGDLPSCAGILLLTFQDFAEEIVRVNDPAARPLSDVQRRLLSDAIVADLHVGKELSHFQAVIDTRGFAEGVCSLLGELKRNEIWPAQFVRAAYRRNYQGTQVARTRNGQPICVKDRQCARIYARYQSILMRQQLFDMEGRVWYARDLLHRGRRRPFENVRAVFVDGFVEFTRTQHAILAELARVVDEIWIALPDETEEIRAELFPRSRATLQRFMELNPRVEYLERPAADIAADVVSPVGLRHLERELFRPARAARPSDRADGVLLIEAPGMVGEVRMVARAIKSLLLAGTLADEVLVTVRDLVPYADLVREVFAEYGIPLDMEGTEPLLRNGAVATLVRAVRLPDENWQFGPVTALLRSGYFRPDWPETTAVPEVASQAEVLLRLLGEPRGRDVYLRSTDLWADRPPAGLEDEQAEESIRQRKHQLAIACRPFLRRFFGTWDDAPTRAPLAEHVAWARRFANEIGLARVAAQGPRDATALGRLWNELDHWLRLEQQVYPKGRLLSQPQFHRLLGTIAAEAGLARTSRGPGRVRVLSTGLARTLSVPHLFVMGLGERSFPRLVAPEPFFDEAERQAFHEAGVDFSLLSDRMPEEMLLFYQIVTRARRQLVLSYPAVDDKGQTLLPSSFLIALFDCFTPGTIAVERRRMLIEGYDRDTPLSPAEHRVRVASQMTAGQPLPSGLPVTVAANLTAAARVAAQRFHSKEHGLYDGLLRHPAVVAEVGRLFGPERVLSPTALEEYVACPFRFFLDHVLKLEPLEEPSEEIESTERGLVFHRALSRLHLQLAGEGIHEPTATVGPLLQKRLDEAVGECSVRASPAGKVLWELEGQRLLKRGERYEADWEKFVKTWQPAGIRPRPVHFERGFGLKAEPGEEMAAPLVIRVDGVEVRIGGRIDRVDLAETDEGLYFWIIDYKTGRSANYSGASLKSFDRLQLTLYALAVERVLLSSQNARPVGLAYWLVTDTGPKVVMPGSRGHQAWFAEPQRWPEVRTMLEQVVTRLVQEIRGGTFPLHPRSEDCTKTCSFSQICRITQARSVDKTWNFSLPVIP